MKAFTPSATAAVLIFSASLKHGDVATKQDLQRESYANGEPCRSVIIMQNQTDNQKHTDEPASSEEINGMGHERRMMLVVKLTGELSRRRRSLVIVSLSLYVVDEGWSVADASFCCSRPFVSLVETGRRFVRSFVRVRLVRLLMLERRKSEKSENSHFFKFKSYYFSIIFTSSFAFP